MFEHLDGKTTVPTTSRGPISKTLAGYQKLLVINFLSNDSQIPLLGINVFRKDQQYLLYISKAIKSGTCKEDFTIQDPGHFHIQVG